MPYDPSFYGIFWGHIFANMGGGGGQNYFHPWRTKRSSNNQANALSAGNSLINLVRRRLLNQ